MDKPTAAAPVSGAKQQIEKQARQLAYDTRYKVKQAMSDKSGARLDPAAVRKAYMAQLGKSSAAPAVKARAKQMLLGEDLINTRELANESVIFALRKVFVEGIEEVVEENEYLQQLNEMEDKKYKIRVTDKKTGNTYVRMATRSKIAELRANSNIASVEMTSYGEVNKSEASKGESTAKTKSGKGLDPVGQEDKDIDNDGDHDKTDKYLMKRRKAIGNAIATRKEEVIYEKEDGDEAKKITGKGVNNYKSKSVKVFPEVSEQIKPDEDLNPTQQKPVQQKPVQQKSVQKEPVQKEPVQQEPVQQNTSSISQVLLAKQRVNAAQKDLANKQRMAAQKQVDLQSLSASYEAEGEQIDEKITAKTDMGAAIDDFYTSKSPQLAGRTKEERRKAAIAAVLTARRGGKKLGEDCGCEEEPKLKKSEGGIEDPREIPTKTNLVKNKLRAMGLKMSYEPEGDQLSEREDSPYEKASDAALDNRYGYGRASGDKRSFGRAANRSSAAAALRAIRRGERSGSGTSTEAGADAVHRGWAKTAKTSTDQTPEKKAKRAVLANTPYSKLPDDEKEKDRVSFNAVRAVYKARKSNLSASYEPEGELVDENLTRASLRRREERNAARKSYKSSKHHPGGGGGSLMAAKAKPQEPETPTEPPSSNRGAIRFGKVNSSFEPEGEVVEELSPTQKDVLAAVRASAGPGLMTGPTKKKRLTPKQKKEMQDRSNAYIKRTSDYLHSSPRD